MEGTLTVAVGHDGVIASGHPAVSRAGMDMLERGGNAVDAAVAAMFTAFHAEPLLTSAGGAGFAVALVDDEPVAVDFFAAAPGMGLGLDGPWSPPPGSFRAVEVDFGSARQVFHIGPGSVAVPGAVPGLLGLQSHGGRLPATEVLQPAYRAIAEGTVITPMGAFATDLLWPIVDSSDALRATFVDEDGARLPVGAIYRNPDLARFLDAVAARGASALSHGPLAELLVDEVRRGGGGLTASDLEAYRVAMGAPVRVDASGDELFLAPPPSVGGMWIAFAHALLDGLAVPEPDSVGELLLLRAVFTVANAERVAVCGDATPTEAHVRALLDPARVARGRRQVQHLLQGGTAPLPVGPVDPLGGTTHLSVIDRWGNACAITVSNGECSGVVLPGHGVFINNFLGEEDINPLGFHRFSPGVRLGSAMCPMIVKRGDGTVMALGSGGSNRIRTALVQVVRQLLVRGRDPEAAVRADRIHVEPGRLYAEAAGGLRATVVHLREAMDIGVFPERNMFFGGTHLAVRRPDGLCIGVGDDRRSGDALTAS